MHWPAQRIGPREVLGYPDPIRSGPKAKGSNDPEVLQNHQVFWWFVPMQLNDFKPQAISQLRHFNGWPVHEHTDWGRRPR